MYSSDSLKSLNTAQREAVEQTEGAVLILAGAGTGKTRVLIERLKYILSNGLAPPWAVLCVTFTNKAANELQSRIGDIAMPWLGTFHKLGLRILRSYSETVGLHSRFTILDTDEQLGVLKIVMERNNVDAKRYSPKILLNRIERLKDRGIAPEQIQESMDRTEGAVGLVGLGSISFVDLYEGYQRYLKTINAVDFGDLLMLPLQIFTKEPAIGREYQDRFRYILVDEFQDTNTIQYLFIKYLAKKWGNICCVGDEDQSIYSWRGAEIDNLFQFEKDFSKLTVIRLEANYRSTPAILGGAQGLIENNQKRLGKKLYASALPSHQNLIHIYSTWNSRDEALLIAELITQSSYDYNDMAVMVRTVAQTREIEEIFLERHISYRLVGNIKFYAREEIRDIIAYMKATVQKNDMALLRIINKPSRKIGNKTIQTISDEAGERGISFFQLFEIIAQDPTDSRCSKIKPLYNVFAHWRAEEIKKPLKDWVFTLSQESGLLSLYEKNPGKIENLKELLNALKDYNSAEEFLEQVALMLGTDDSSTNHSYVNLMTIHAAKGLEFSEIFLPGWEEGIFPNARALGDGLQNIEEERRLAYVGITRGRFKVNILFSMNRYLHGRHMPSMPSRFIKEIPEKFTKHLGVSPTYTQLYTSRNASPTFQVGDSVAHNKFGTGYVVNIESEHIHVQFEDNTLRIILQNYLQKTD